MYDFIGNAHMSQGNLSSFTFDRFGNPNSALSLNGGFTQVPPGYYFNSPQFSITVWIYPYKVGIWSRIFDFSNPGSNPIEEIFLSFSTSLSLFPTIRILSKTSTLIADSKSNFSLEVKKWYFLTATFNGSFLSLYVNGTLTNTSKVVSGQIPLVQRTNNFFGKSKEIKKNSI